MADFAFLVDCDNTLLVLIGPTSQRSIQRAVRRPDMRFVQPKAIEQQDLQVLHRIRNRLIGLRTKLPGCYQ